MCIKKVQNKFKFYFFITARVFWINCKLHITILIKIFEFSEKFKCTNVHYIFQSLSDSTICASISNSIGMTLLFCPHSFQHYLHHFYSSIFYYIEKYFHYSSYPMISHQLFDQAKTNFRRH